MALSSLGFTSSFEGKIKSVFLPRFFASSIIKIRFYLFVKWYFIPKLCLWTTCKNWEPSPSTCLLTYLSKFISSCWRSSNLNPRIYLHFLGTLIIFWYIIKVIIIFLRATQLDNLKFLKGYCFLVKVTFGHLAYTHPLGSVVSNS